MLKKTMVMLIMAASVTLSGCNNAIVDKNSDNLKDSNAASSQGKQTNEQKEQKTPQEITVLKNESGEIIKPKVVVSGTEYLYDNAVIVSDPSRMDILVNRTYNLPSDYVPEDLVRVEVPFADGRVDDVKYMRKEASDALTKMFTAAEKEGFILAGASGYRSYSIQTALFTGNVNRKGSIATANKVSALPGQSEHQSGLAMDISSKSMNYQLLETFADTAEGKWLAENAHKYGFILRYPKEKEEITGYLYEPWHFRYITVDTATILHDSGLTLEEYYEKK